MRIVAVDRLASRNGLSAGLTLADARARLPQLVVHEHQPEADLMLMERIAEWCDRYTPVVAMDAPNGVTLEIAGSAHLFGGEDRLVADMRRRLVRQGLSVRASVAGTAAAARAHARHGRPGIVAPGGERQAAMALTVKALELGQEHTVALRRAGLNTIADLADRPRKPLAARFGMEMIERLSGILGEADRPILSRRPLPEFMSERRFADPIGLSDDVDRALRELAEDLCVQLEKHGAGGRVFEASFFRADGATRRIGALSARPLRDPASLMRLFATRMDALADPVDPGFGFDMMRLASLAEQELDATQTGFEKAGSDFDRAEAEALSDLIDRLTARFGTAAVERFVPHESHVPERAARRAPAVSDRIVTTDWPDPEEGEPAQRPLLLFTPPQPVETVAEVPDGPPYRFRWRRIMHEVVRAEGPERIAPEWWRAAPGELTRDYYRVEDSFGRRFWLFRHGVFGREHSSPGWFIHGLFP